MTDTQDSERAAVREARRQALINWIPSEIAKQPAKFAEFEKALADDVAGFSMAFIRFGDFVCVRAWRNKNESTKAIQLERMPMLDEKGKPTARLKPASITLSPGFAPALGAGGAARAYGSGNANFTAEITHRGNRAVPYEYVYGGMSYWSGNDGSISVPIEAGMAQPAVDDAISFDGAGVILQMPFGTGQTTYDALLKAIRKDFAA